jgi:hypothetical protein
MMAKLKGKQPEVAISAPVLKSRLLALQAAPTQQKSYFWLTYGSADGLVGVIIVEASTLIHARMRASVQGLAAGALFAEGHELSARLMALAPSTKVGRMLSGAEATELIGLLDARPRRANSGRAPTVNHM